jgi:hypothetical protein
MRDPTCGIVRSRWEGGDAAELTTTRGLDDDVGVDQGSCGCDATHRFNPGSALLIQHVKARQPALPCTLAAQTRPEVGAIARC